jgi:adenine-specific DNA-methyltransferase
MCPRLKLLKDLLADDGVIYISIDDNELHRLLMLLDEEIFGEENYIGTICWRNETDNNPTLIT